MRPVGLWRIVVLLFVITPIDYFGETKRTWRRLRRLGGVHRVGMGAGAGATGGGRVLKLTH